MVQPSGTLTVLDSCMSMPGWLCWLAYLDVPPRVPSCLSPRLALAALRPLSTIDEFEHGAQYRVVTCILELLSLGNIVSVKFFITGRPNAEGEIDLRAYPGQIIHLLLEDSKDEIDVDIRFVIRHRLERMVKRGACKPLVRDTLERMLVAKADQTFLPSTIHHPLSTY